MIDYDKLKLAHELSQKFANKVDGNFVLISQQIDYFGGQEENIMYRSNLIQGGLIECSLDNLIAKLRELTQEEDPSHEEIKWHIGSLLPNVNQENVAGWMACDGRKLKNSEYPVLSKMLSKDDGDYFYLPVIPNYFIKTDITVTQPEEPKAKYKAGDEIYYLTTLDDGELIIRCGLVLLDHFHEPKRDFSFCYPTKSALIEAQLAYWQSLHNHSENKLETVECQHDFRYESWIDGFHKICHKCELDIILTEDEKFRYFSDSMAKTSYYLEGLEVETVPSGSIEITLC